VEERRLWGRTLLLLALCLLLSVLGTDERCFDYFLGWQLLVKRSRENIEGKAAGLKRGLN
jgi:hypothetical protein